MSSNTDTEIDVCLKPRTMNTEQVVSLLNNTLDNRDDLAPENSQHFTGISLFKFLENGLPGDKTPAIENNGETIDREVIEEYDHKRRVREKILRVFTRPSQVTYIEEGDVIHTNGRPFGTIQEIGSDVSSCAGLHASVSVFDKHSGSLYDADEPQIQHLGVIRTALLRGEDYFIVGTRERVHSEVKGVDY